MSSAILSPDIEKVIVEQLQKAKKSKLNLSMNKKQLINLVLAGILLAVAASLIILNFSLYNNIKP